MNELPQALVELEQTAQLSLHSFSPEDAPLDESQIHQLSTEAYTKLIRENNTDDYQTLATRFPAQKADLELALCSLALERRDYEQAVTHCQTALKSQHYAPYINSHLGYALLQLGRLPEARVALLSAINGRTAVAQNFFNLGQVERRLGHTVAAADAFEKAIQRDRFYYKAYLKLALVELRLGRWRSAWSHLRKSIPSFDSFQQASAGN